MLLISCSLNDGVNALGDSTELEKIESFWINVPEPSGLALNVNGTSLWTVSDHTAKVYQLSFSGQLLKTLRFQGEDLEGVSQSPLDFSLWVTEERSRELVQLDTLGTEIERSLVNVENREENSGLEGAAIDPQSGARFIANEKKPALIARLNSRNQIQESWDIHITEDCSGLAFEPSGEFIWFVSDESKKVVKLNRQGNRISTYKINVDKAEGIAVSTADSLIYIVSDSEQKLYLFRMK